MSTESPFALQLVYAGREYHLDTSKLDVSQLARLRRHISIKAFKQGLAQGDLKALRALYWLMLVQNGTPEARIGAENFKPVKLIQALAASKSLELIVVR